MADRIGGPRAAKWYGYGLPPQMLRALTAGFVVGVLASPLPAQPPAPDEPADSTDEPSAKPVPTAQPEVKPAAPGKSAAALESEESLSRMQQLLRQRPFHGPAFEGVVKSAIDKGKLNELVEEYKSKVAAIPDDIALRIILARLHLRNGDAAAASAIMDKIQTLPPEMARMASELLVLKAEIYQRAGNNAAAEKVLKEAQDKTTVISEKLRLAEALADVYIRDSRKDDAIAAFNSAAAQFPDNYAHQRRIAGALAQRGLHEAALARFQAILPLVATETDRKCEVLREIGQVQEKLNRREEAIAAYTEAAGLLASDHWMQKDLQERIVGLYRAANKLEDLARFCQEQIKKSPEQTSTRVLLADVQAAMGKMEDGKQTLATAVELFPKDVALSSKRIEYLERAGDAEAAATEYERIIGQHPQDAELYIAYGQSLANSKRVEGARNQWRHVLSTKVDDPGLANRLGALFETYELYDDAAEAYERAIKSSPKQPEGYAALSRLWMVRGDVDKAASALDRMGAANPADGAVQAALAQALRSMGKNTEALAAITKACELMPDQVRHHQLRSDLLIQNGQLEEGLAVRRAIIDKMTNPVQRAEAIATLVSMHGAGERMAALKAGEEKHLQEKPSDAVSLLILARVADTEHNFPEQRKCLETLLKADPGNESAQTQMAKLLDATGDVNGAADIYTRLAQRSPQRARVFYEAIVDLKLRYGDRAGAIETLHRMAREDQNSAVAQSAVADQLVRMDEFEKSLPYFEAALKLQPDRHESRLEYAKALTSAGRLDEALTTFRAVATQRADTDRAFEAIGRMHDVASQLGRLEELVDELRQQVEVDPSNTLVARAVAELHVRELEYNKAVELLDLVSKHNPRDVDLALTRAEVLRRLARYDEAVEEYQRVLRFPQTDRDFVLGELGKTQFESGHVDQARRLWKQIQNKLYSGTLLKNNGLLDEAIAAFEEGIRIKPDEYALHRNLIQAYEAAGKTPEALKAARRLLDLDPGNSMNIERLAEANLRAGDRAGAAQVASRLFAASVGADKSARAGGGGRQSLSGAMYQAMSSQYGGYGQGGARSNLDRGIGFFVQNGLLAELNEVLQAQIASQPENAVLKMTAARLYSGELNEPERALKLYHELEGASFPVEHQTWLGQCSQRDHMRILQYGLIASKPAIRDKELGSLEAKKSDELSRDELLELAVIRNAQGNSPAASDLLERVVTAAPDDALALGVLTDLLVAAEKFDKAEPHARRLVELLERRRQELQAGTIERVRRDFVRSLPLEFQLRVTDDLLADIADKWTLGSAWSWWDPGTVQAVGYLKSRLTLATILAETGRVKDAADIWRDLSPKRGPDADRWTMLGDVAQLHKQDDLAFEFYQHALKAAKALAGDPLLRQVYTSSTSQMSWYGEEGTINKSFSAIVESFAKRDALVELYDFLRDTDQQQRARRVCEQYKLSDKLIPIYRTRVQEAAKAFRASHGNALQASVPYFAEVCKLAELLERTPTAAGEGAASESGWDAAQRVYADYLADFPDELELLSVLGEVAEARQKVDEAVAWERKVIDCKTRLSRKAREWSMRDLSLTPTMPQILGKDRSDMQSWAARWGQTPWWYGNRDQLDRTASWMRLADLYLTADNTIAAADAMQRAVADAADALQRALAEAGSQRDSIIQQVLGTIRTRHLAGKMLPVLRTLAVFAPSDEQVQLTYAESLQSTGKKDLALEVCNRMLRRGVSDLRVLAEVRRRVAALSPDAAPKEATIASLEAEAAADKANTKARLRLAKAQYYSLQLDKAEQSLTALAADAPHLEDLQDLLVDVYTLRGDTDKLVEALKAKIARTTDDRKRRTTRWRLVNELLGAGRNDEAMTIVKELGDPRDPRSFSRIGTLLHYFGKHEDATACFQQVGKSKRGNQGYGGGEGPDFGLALSLVISGDFAGAADKVLSAIEEQSRQQTQYGGMYAMYDQSGGNAFVPLQQAFVIYPQLVSEIGSRLEKLQKDKPTDPQAAKTLMAFYSATGRPDKAQSLLDEMAKNETTDQAMVMKLIDRAQKDRDVPRAIALAERFIAQTPKPKLPPGMPPQYAGMMALQSPRTVMLCRLGDIYWDRNAEGDRDKAFETYKQIIDEKVDDSRLAYATICLVRGRAEEAKELLDKALAAQQVKPPKLLMFSAFMAALDGKLDSAFDAIAQASAPGVEEQDRFSGYSESSPLSGLALLAQRGGAPLMEKFAKVMQERIQQNPNDWENYQTLSQAYRQAGRPADAMKVIEAAEKVSTLTQQALQQRLSWTRAEIPLRDQIPLYEKMIELAEKSSASSNSGPMARYSRRGGYGMDAAGPAQTYRDSLAWVLWETGEKEKAEKLWTARMNEQSAEAHIRLARLYAQTGDVKREQEEYARASELDPDNITAHTAVAQAAFEQDPPDLKSTMQHMLECFLRRSNTESENDRAYSSYSYYGGSYPWTQDDDSDGDDRASASAPMVRWAMAIQQDPRLPEYLAQPNLADRADDCRIMLASLTGDWSALEPLLKKRIDAGTPDPMIWRLWARAQQRKGDLAGAARSFEFLRRAALTSIGDHREQLKLVLAGKQLKEAAGGTRDANPNSQVPAMPGTSTSSYSSNFYPGMYDDYSGDARGGSRLPTLYIKLGDFVRAERLYLMSSGEAGIENKLPSLASLMWQQKSGDGGGKERALELMRLALSLPSDRNSYYYGSRGLVERYAAMLADQGPEGRDKAIELLVRAYRFNAADERNSAYEMMYARGPDQEMEQGAEQTISTTLFGILEHAGEQTLGATPDKLTQQAVADPDDVRLGKLVLTLQKQGKRWTQLRDGLAARAESLAKAGKSAPLAESLELFHAECQLAQWDRALAVLERLRKDSPRQEDQWNAHEAFVRLMKDDNAGAAALAQKLLDHVGRQDYNVPATAGLTILAAAQANDVLADRLARMLENGDAAEFNDSAKSLLFSVLLVQKKWDQALALALDEFWKDSGVLAPSSRWWDALATVRRQSMAAGTRVAPSQSRPEDAALLELAADPATGLRAMEALAAAPVTSLNALRGYAFAAALVGDDQKSLVATRKVVDWITQHRNEGWYQTPQSPLQRSVKAMVDQMAQSGTASIPQSFGFSMQITQLLQTRNEGSSPLVTHAQLLPAYQRSLLRLTARVSDEQALQNLLAQPGVINAGSQNDRAQYRFNSYSYSGRFGGYYPGRYGGNDDVEDSTMPKPQERAAALRRALWSAGKEDRVLAELAKLGNHIPETERSRREEASVACGTSALAAQVRQERARTMLVRMLAADTPNLGASSYEPYSWYWYSASSMNQVANSVRSALQRGAWGYRDDDDEDARWGGRSDGGLAALALADDKIAQDLLSCESLIGPEWGSTQTAAQLVSFYRGKKQPEKVIGVIEKTITPGRSKAEELVRSPLLSEYLAACYKARDTSRITPLLDAALKVSSALESDVQIARLITLRMDTSPTAKAQADALEAQFLAKCADEPENPKRPVKALRSLRSMNEFASWQDDDSDESRGSYYRNYGSARQTIVVDPRTISQLAQACGVRYSPKVDWDDPSLSRLATAYRQCGLPQDAARILDLQLAKAKSVEENYRLMLSKADCLRRAKDPAGAQRVCQDLERLLSDEAKADPESDAHQWLISVYLSKAYGGQKPDYAKAIAAIESLRSRDPAYTANRADEIRCLYELGRFKEAWRAAQAAQRDIATSLAAPEVIYFAGLSACLSGESGADECGKRLLRRAIFRYPDSPQLTRAREVLHE